MPKKPPKPQVTRKHYLEIPFSQWLDLKRQALRHGYLRNDIWQKFCTPDIVKLTSIGKVREAAQQYIVSHDIHGLQRKPAVATAIDTINAIRAYHDAAKEAVLVEIRKSGFSDERKKALRGMVYHNKPMDDPWLHRHYRKHFVHGRNRTFDHIVLENKNGYSLSDHGVMTVSSLIPRRPLHFLVPKNIDINGKIRIFVDEKPGNITIHWTEDRKDYKPCGTKELGIDKGYNEAFVDSDGEFYGPELKELQQNRADYITKKNRNRSRIYQHEKRLREAGDIEKADRIRRNNLGRNGQKRRTERFQRQVRALLYKEAHRLMNKAGHIVLEDLKFTSKNIRSKVWQHRLNKWVKGELAEILEDVAAKRGCEVTLVNAAYTSQTDSQTGYLEGRRAGEKFYHASGDVSHAGVNAAVNIKQRAYREDITLYTPVRKVKSLLSRTAALVEEQGFNPLPGNEYQPG